MSSWFIFSILTSRFINVNALAAYKSKFQYCLDHFDFQSMLNDGEDFIFEMITEEEDDQ